MALSRPLDTCDQQAGEQRHAGASFRDPGKPGLSQQVAQMRGCSAVAGAHREKVKFKIGGREPPVVVGPCHGFGDQQCVLRSHRGANGAQQGKHGGILMVAEHPHEAQKPEVIDFATMNSKNTKAA